MLTKTCELCASTWAGATIGGEAKTGKLGSAFTTDKTASNAKNCRNNVILN